MRQRTNNRQQNTSKYRRNVAYKRKEKPTKGDKSKSRHQGVLNNKTMTSHNVFVLPTPQILSPQIAVGVLKRQFLVNPLAAPLVM
jgi:hypothetical protein